MKKCLTILLVAIMLLCMVPNTVFAASEIIAVGVDDILEPIDGSKLDFSGVPAHSNKYSITKIFWSEYDSEFDEWERDMEANDTCIKGNNYVVFVTLEAKDGYTFSSNMTATINGAKANKYQLQDNGKKIQIYCAFVCKKNIERVDLTIVKPVIGKTPTFARVNTDEYESKNISGVSNQTNGVTWTNQSSGINLTISNPFKENTKYTVKYYLTAKDNCWFNGTKYYINGNQVELISSNAGMTEVVVGLTDLVPGDGKKEIGTLDLSVTAPKEGEKPDYTKIDGTGYYSDNGINGSSTKIYKNGIAWYKSASSYISPGTTETFKADNSYIVKISLSPKDGYKFTKSLTAKINGKTATVETFDDGSVTVSLTLTTLKKEHKHTDSEWKNDKENHWKVCTDKNCGTITVAKEGHKDSNKDNKCDTCGYAIEKEETPTTSTPSTNDTPTTSTPSTDTTPSVSTPTTSESQTSTPEVEQPQDTEVEDTTQDVATDTTDDNQDEESSAWIWIVAAAVVVLGGCATVAIVLIKKKK